MLEVRLIGRFDIQCDGKPVLISSRAAQSLFAYLIMTAGTSHRREKLAGMFWPDASEEKARAYLRHELWRIRKTLAPKSKINYLISDDINVSFNSSAEYWFDVNILTNASESASIEELTNRLSVFQGEFLPGFYDDWVTQERENLRLAYETNVARLLELLVSEKCWNDILEWAERWISFGQGPEAAFRYLMIAYDALGDRAKVAATYERCRQALRELDLELSEQTRALAFKRTANLNIPISLTSFVGREKELKEVAELFSKSRLVTLTGSGGVGKTRLAIQVVADVLDRFPDGGWFLDLAPLTDPALVPHTLANLLGLRESGEKPITEILINYFHARNALLIFDNCEHLIESCAQLVNSLLISCTDLFVLATSREALRISGEIPYRVPSLEVPKWEMESDMDMLLKTESVRLFLERATLASSPFAIHPQNAPVIAKICQRLDGIPLAIELAAARVNVLTVEQILKRLDDRFGLLTSGLRSALPRHQTLRAMIEWSCDLLSEKERILFRRLAVFVDGWTLEAAESVCVDIHSILKDILKSEEILELLTQLVNKSLVMAAKRNGEIRYHMLETIRQFGNEKLIKSGERMSLSEQHLNYFLHFAESAAPYLTRSEQLEWLARLDEDYENLRAALGWALSKNSPELSLRLCAALSAFWIIRSYHIEGSNWLKGALSKSSGKPGIAETAARVRALYHDAYLAMVMDEIERSRFSAELSLDLASKGMDRLDIAIARFHVGLALDWRKEGDVAGALLQQSLEEFRELSNPYWHAVSFRQLGHVLRRQGKLKSGEWCLQAVELAHKAGERLNLADALWDYSQLLYGSNRIDEGMHYAQEADILYRQIGSRLNLTPLAIAITAWLKGDHKQAREILTKMQEHLVLLGEKNSRSVVLANLGLLAAEEEDFDQAHIYLGEALASARALGNQDFVARRLIELGNLCFLEGNIEAFKKNYRESYILVKDLDPFTKRYSLHFVLDSIHSRKPEQTACLLGAIDSFERESIEPIFPLWKRYYYRAETHVRQALSANAFESAFAEGQKMSLDEALDLALRTVEEM